MIILGAFFVNTANWHPFLPNGFGGVMTGVAAVFFAYIGFDALSTTAEECKDPYKTLPRGMIYSLDHLHRAVRHARSGADRNGQLHKA